MKRNTLLLILALLGVAAAAYYFSQKKTVVCKPTNSANHSIYSGSATGTGCTEAAAREAAKLAYGSSECEGSTADPKCPSNGHCNDNNEECKTTVVPHRDTITCTRTASDDCEGGYLYTCEINPTRNKRAKCDCTCA